MVTILAGGTGLLGQALAPHLAAAGHRVRILTRRTPAAPNQVQWHPDGASGPWASHLADADVIINLAGDGIGDKRWTPQRKAALRTSRILPARSLARALDEVPPRPRLVIASSGIGYYGARGDEPITEESGPGDDFLADLCVGWEREAATAASPTTRVALIRSGLVLHPDGGALKPMLLPFRLGIGGPMGTGRQYWSWIHWKDWVALVTWLATDVTLHSSAAVAPSEERGEATAWNVTAPEPVTNAAFARMLGRVLHRPAVLPAPAFALRIVLGEFSTFVTGGARVLPARATRAGFRFAFPELEPALVDLLRPRG